MSFHSDLIFLLLFGCAVPAAGCSEGNGTPVRRELRVCADPNNMPFSNAREQGFENRLARLVAHDLNVRVSYHWWPQRRGFVRNTLKAGKCDVIMGVPTSFERVQVTSPYYRSTYVFVSRQDWSQPPRSLDDPVLRTLRIGIHTIGDDYANAPPAQALARRGIIENVRGYSIYGDYSRPDPPADLIAAVARGDIDVAIAWGPLAGYFAAREPIPLRLTPITPQVDLPFVPFVYDISVGVRRGDDSLAAGIERVLQTRRTEIQKLLATYHVPLVGETSIQP